MAQGRSQPWARRLYQRNDAILGVVLGVLILAESFAQPLQAIPAVFMGLSLALRRTAPLVMAALIAALSAFDYAPASNDESVAFVIVAYLMGLYSIAAYERSFIRAAIAGLVVAVAINMDLVVHGLSADPDFWLQRLFFIAGSWIAGRVLHHRHQEVDELAGQQEARTRRAIAEERARLARELHDVIAHNVSVMVVQAAAAEEVLTRQPERAGQPLRTIQSTGRQTITELRRLLGILRADDREVLTAPQPTLSEIDSLVETVRAAGLPVELEVSGEAAQLPTSLDVSAYRIVQEGLTNALRHSGAASAKVRVRFRSDAVELEVLDDGAGASSNGDAGHGLLGIRERVAMFGGSVESGTRPEGGFRLKAVLPVEEHGA